MEGLRVAASHGLWVFWLSYAGLLIGVLAVIGGLQDKTGKKDTNPIVTLIVFGALFAVFSPVLRSVWAVVTALMHWPTLLAFFEAMGSGAIIWGVPGLLLGALVPMLRRAGRSPQSWALIGYGAAALLVLASVLTRNAWPLLPGLIALGSGVLFRRGMPVKEFWPFAALCVAIGVSGAMSVAQKITFQGVLKNLHTIDELRPALPTPPPAQAEAPLIKRLPESDLALAPIRPQPSLESQRLIDALSQPDRVHPLTLPRPGDMKAPPGGAFEDKSPKISPFLNDSSKSPEVNQQDMQALVDAIAKGRGDKPAVPAGAPAATLPVHPAEPQPATITAPKVEAPVAKNEAAGATNTKAPEEKKESPEDAAKALEVSIAGSVGFWTTVGLLACWSMWEREEAELVHASSEKVAPIEPAVEVHDQPVADDPHEAEAELPQGSSGAQASSGELVDGELAVKVNNQRVPDDLHGVDM
jgi:hypothetical protein